MTSPLAVADDPGWIGGLSIGRSTANIDEAQITENLLGTGLVTTSMSDDNSDFAYKLFGGYKFNENFAVEAGYFDLGQFGFAATTTPVGTLSGNIQLRGLNLDAVGILPLGDAWSVFGRLGVNYAQAKDAFAGSGAVTVTDTNPSKTELNPKVGLGVQYDFSESVGLRGEWERYRINDAVGSRGDINLISIGLVVMLDAKKAAPPRAAVAAAPVMVVVPVKVKTQKYCTVLDVQFEIKQDEVKREDKEKLAVLGVYMNKYPDTTAVIEGHSDNVGTSEFNRKLSLERAQGMMDYLVTDHKINPSRLSVRGYGETRPVADNSTKEGQQANRRIEAVIACVTDVAGLKVAPARMTIAMEMEFDPYKSDVDPSSYDGLNEVAKFMKANPSVTATVEGHAGKYLGVGHDKVRVNPKLAMDISKLRAQKVVDYLVDKGGIARSRLSTEAYGQTEQVSYGTTLDGQAENRRVNIIINYRK
jgi:OOP family OmpA-OmpF porin